MKEIFTHLADLLINGRPAMLVSIVSCEGSAPRGAGARMLVAEKGRVCGTIGGGAVESAGEAAAKMLLAEGRSLLRKYKLNTQDEDNIGMICGGDVTVHYCFIPAGDEKWKALVSDALRMIRENTPGYLVEPLDSRTPYIVAGGKAALSEAEAGPGFFSEPLPVGERVVIFGGGHIGKELVPLLAHIGFRPVVFDNRPEYTDIARFPGAEKTVLGDFRNIAGSFDLAPDDFIIVMTNGHEFDYIVERQVLSGESAYVGVIGSRSKIAAVNARLAGDGITAEKIASVHTPIGINIKAVTPEEIAISIVAELILVRTDYRAARGEDVSSCPMHILHH